jgi:hypothetical protein
VDLFLFYENVKPAIKLFSLICDAYEKNTCARRLQLQDSFWNACQDPNQLIAKWIARVCMSARDQASVKLTLANQQICGLDDSWKTIQDHLVYLPNKFLLGNTIGSLELHETLTSTLIDHTEPMQSVSFAAKKNGQLQCYKCGEKGHHSAGTTD